MNVIFALVIDHHSFGIQSKGEGNNFHFCDPVFARMTSLDRSIKKKRNSRKIYNI